MAQGVRFGLVYEHLETQMAAKVEYRSAFARRYYAEGEAKGEAKGRAEGRLEGRAEAILEVLAGRGLEVPEETAERVLSCRDLRTLSIWLRRAATAASRDDLFD